MKPIFSVFLLAFCLWLSSCAPKTPLTRIDSNPAMFAALSDRHQQLVRQGQLDRGMSGDAVFLAWGKPSRTFEGSEQGIPTARWDYAALQPVYTTSFGAGYAYGGYGRYGRYGRYGYPYYSVAPRIDYIPYRSATVWFKRGKVDSWERLR